ncbi:MAG: LamG domain-containing protein [Myxococcota bacterium]
MWVMRAPLAAGAIIAGAGCTMNWGAFEPDGRDGGTGGRGGATATTATTPSTSTSSVHGGGGHEESTSSSSGGGGSGGGSTMWFDADYRRRRVIEVGTVTGGPHTDFVVRVRLDASRIDLSTTPGGAGLRFVADDHMTTLVHEVERWAGGERELWVRLPSLDTGTRMYLYYDHPNPTDGAGLPFDQYAAVWHFDDYIDATGGGGMLMASQDSGLVPGYIGQASNHFVTQPTHLNVETQSTGANLFANGGTVSAWIRAVSTGGAGWGRLVDRADDLSGANGWSFHVDSGQTTASSFGLQFERGFGVNHHFNVTQSTSLIDVSTWHHVAVVYDDTQPSAVRFFVDGKEAATSAGPVPLGGPSLDLTTPMRIGDAQEETRSFDGQIDEIRLERVARSAGWIDDDHRSGAEQLLTFGPEEACPPDVCP